ncbi:MAG: hypothetical protein HZB26_03735 [Candidatus Hydrogenedentes bacterium]|nr:hypothetical protein [Candidatus Hydrogenedentota bacterium]
MASNINVASVPEDEPSGVPMGGVGAGCIEMGRDGRFRNITINNNRSTADRIAVAPGSFLAVRAGVKGKVFTRILQPESSAAFGQAGIIPSYTPSEQLSWRGLYPCSHYHLDDPKFPLDVSWSAMAPIIPYDTEASSLPALFIAFFITNPGETAVDVSALVNWENLCGCARDHFPERRGPVLPVVLKREDEAEQEEAEAAEGPPRPAGLEFGFHGELRDNAEGNYCLVAKQQQGVDVSLLAWDERSPDELIHFWEEFHDQGRLRNHLSRNETSHSGAVCCSLTLEPKTSRRLIYVLTWYCPRFVVEGVDLGNGYTNRFRGAVQAAETCLKYHKYFLNSVEAWQKRIFSSSLPRWFCKMLVNNNCVFSTNTLYTKDERFAMFESPSEPLTGSLDRLLYSSLATLLFFPDFAHRELLQFAIAKDPAAPGRIYRSLGALCAHKPQHGPRDQMDINPVFILLAYRNYATTGNLVILRNTWPRIKEAFGYVLAQDSDGDGLPEQSGCSNTFDGWAVYGVDSYTSSLWLAALRAYAKLATALGHKDETKRANTVLAKAVDAFEERLWNADGGAYRLFHEKPAHGAGLAAASETCCSAQLAGQWFADFLCLGHLLPDEHLDSAIRAMSKLLEKPGGVAHGLLPDGAAPVNPPSAEENLDPDRTWPALYVAYYSSLMIYHGKVDRGLHNVQKVYQNIHVTRSIPYNQPFAWDIKTNSPSSHGMERHMAATSIWYAFYAVQGFHMNLPEQTLWIRPNLPKNVDRLSTPLFTPSCFGWLTYKEERAKGYMQTVELALDSPVPAKIIVLRIPTWVEEVTVRCVSTAGEEPTRHMLGFDGADHLVEIQPSHPIVVGNSLTITVTGTRFGKRPTPGTT